MAGKKPTEGVTRCWCGSKYWEEVEHPDTNRKWWDCHSCGQQYEEEMEDN